jgi:hypothetical protein
MLRIAHCLDNQYCYIHTIIYPCLDLWTAPIGESEITRVAKHFLSKLGSVNLNNIRIDNKMSSTPTNAVTCKTLGRFWDKNRNLQCLFRHLKRKYIRKYIKNKENDSTSTLMMKLGVHKCTEYILCYSVYLVGLGIRLLRHGTTACTVPDARKIPLPSHKQFVFVFRFMTTVPKTLSSENCRPQYMYFVLEETPLIS